MIMKDAKTGGAWAWHQDYGYWYQNGVLSPDLCSASIAVDSATRENGCLQVIEGSHLLGRVDHVLTGEQAGADKERVAVILERFPLVYKESHHPRYTPLHKVPDSAILEAGLKRFADSTEDVAFLEDQKDQSARSLGAPSS
jgi:hypothetical protein